MLNCLECKRKDIQITLIHRTGLSKIPLFFFYKQKNQIYKKKPKVYKNISTYIDMERDLLLFKALGEETKHKILKVLLDGELCACDIPLKIKRTQSNTSMHLSKLLDWKLVKCKRKGKMILYSIKDPRIRSMFNLIKKGK